MSLSNQLSTEHINELLQLVVEQLGFRSTQEQFNGVVLDLLEDVPFTSDFKPSDELQLLNDLFNQYQSLEK